MLRSAILNALRDATRPQHDAIEAALDMTNMSRDDYRRLIERFRGFYGPLEDDLGAWDWEAVNLAYAPRRKVPLLDRDLAALGGAHRGAITIRPVSSLAEGFGRLYVTEGAALGGRVITRMLAERWGLTAETGGAFFAGYGADTGVMWRRFCSALEGYCPVPEERVVEAAVETFELMRSWCSAWTSQSTTS